MAAAVAAVAASLPSSGDVEDASPRGSAAARGFGGGGGSAPPPHASQPPHHRRSSTDSLEAAAQQVALLERQVEAQRREVTDGWLIRSLECSEICVQCCASTATKHSVISLQSCPGISNVRTFVFQSA